MDFKLVQNIKDQAQKTCALVLQCAFGIKAKLKIQE